MSGVLKCQRCRIPAIEKSLVAIAQQHAAPQDYPAEFGDPDGIMANRCMICGCTFTGKDYRRVCRLCQKP
jgi:hypothetical protein